MALRRLLARRRRNDVTPPPAPPIYIYPGLLRTAPARAVLLDALCPAAPYAPAGSCRGDGTTAIDPAGQDEAEHRNDDDDPVCCPICFDDFTETSLVRTLYCSHQYHSQCLLAWLLKGYAARCPMCSASLSLPVECVADPGGKDSGTACARALVRTTTPTSSHSTITDGTSTATAGTTAGTAGDGAPPFASSQDLVLSMFTPIVQLPEAGVGIQTLCAVPHGEADGESTMRSYCYMEHDFARFNKKFT